MDQALPTDDFNILLGMAIKASRDGDGVSEELYQDILGLIPILWENNGTEAIALALRQLGPFCDWSDFRWSEDKLSAGGSIDELHLEIRRIDDEREASYKSPEFNSMIESVGNDLKQFRTGWEAYVEKLRGAETLMGFDQGVNRELISTLKSWDDTDIPKSLLDLLPEDLTFPLLSPGRSTPYDHRVHLLVNELVSRLLSEDLFDETVVRHCGHVMADFMRSEDEESASDLVLTQITLLADDYVEKHPWDMIGLCWRGELACWAKDTDLAHHCASMVWKASSNATAKSVDQVVAFFALSQRSIYGWNHSSWPFLEDFLSHLSNIKDTWVESEQRLASAILRRTFLKGNWDVSLLRSTFLLEDHGYGLESGDAPAECWIWMAEHIDHSSCGVEFYYCHWGNAYKALKVSMDPRLAHNILAVLLVGRLFNTSSSAWVELPSMQELLNSLSEIHRSGTTPEKKLAVLETTKYFYRKVNPSHLTAADRLAIARVVVESASPSEQMSSVEPPTSHVGDEQVRDVPQILLEQAEIFLKSQIGESTWARLSTRAREEFRLGEFLYIIASKQAGEGGTFDSFVLHYSNGLLAEIQESLRGPSLKGFSLEGEFRDLLGQKDPPEWAQLARIVPLVERIQKSAYLDQLIKQRVLIHKVRDLYDFFMRMNGWRKVAAHTRSRVSRDEATLMHGLLVNAGMIRKIVEFFPKVPGR